MSWKTAPPDNGAAPGVATRSGRRPWSLALRLAVGYGSAAFALLLVACRYADWALAQSLRSEDVNFLAEEVEEVEMLLRSEPDGVGALREHLRRETAAHLSSPLYIRAVDESGNTLAASQGMDDIIPAALFPSARVDGK